jgi:glycosidase
MNGRRFSCVVLVLLFLAFGARDSRAVLANAFHIPDDSGEALIPGQSGITMRNPEFEVGTATTVTIYSGEQKLNNSFGTANQTGGTLYYRSASQGIWVSTNLAFANNNGNNQYWSASFNTLAFGTDDVIQYYLYLTFDGVNGVQNTYVYGSDAVSSTTVTQSVAAAAPFSIRDRPAWLFHANNRVVDPGSDSSHNNVEFWIKEGYIGEDGTLASRWADSGAIYYTTDGSAPSGALGAGSGSTQTVALNFDDTEDDPSIAGNAMWWVGIATNLPVFTTINYKIGVWDSDDNQEKFADYNASTNNTTFTFSIGSVGAPVLTVNGVNADYTTTHLFVDEVAGDSIPLTILFSPGASNVTEADVFSNLNRRDRATQDANGDGVDDGILPPDGNTIATGDDNNYYKAYAMTATSTPGQYSLTLNAQKTGAYRLTARYKVAGGTNWNWYTSNGRRDHAIVVSPTKARNMVIYELNAMTMDSQGTQDYQRSTFTDLYNGPGSRPYDAVTNRFNLSYATNLGINWLWFQPIHPIGIDGRQTDSNGVPYSVGSPYSVKNFYQVNQLLSKANTRAAALQEFQGFVAAADAAGVNVMLDEPFNHTSFDCELDTNGINYLAAPGNPGNWQPTDEIRNREARFYSMAGNYCSRASSAANVAQAPDRGDFGKWSDVHDVFFGVYAALVCENPQDNGSYLNEADWFDYSSGTNSTGNFDYITQDVWRYFSDSILYWLDQTGCTNGTPASQTSVGIDGLRADFGQGLPPQCWEYIINKTRSRKWDFVFMTESLDGGAVTYRSNRHFDVLNENAVFSFQTAATATDYRNIFDDRRNSYGQGLVLWNSTSHDEESYVDPYQALIRYLVGSTIDGAPMVFYGQELGISQTFGFDVYQLNFGKLIPHFMVYNSLQPIFSPANRNYGLDQLYPVYAAAGQARQFSAALKSSNRYYLNQTGSETPQPSIFSVAKYATANASPNFSDVVFAFVNLDRNNNQQGNFDVNITQNGSNLFGIKPGRIYNVRNIAAYTQIDGTRRTQYLIPGNVSGTNLLNNGLFVLLKSVPTTTGGWSTDPFEAQYLKLYDVTPPATPAVPGTPKPYAVGDSVTFTWPALVDPDGGVSAYHVIVGATPGGSNVFNGTVTGTSLTVTNSFGQTLYASVSAISNAGVEGGMSAGSSGTTLLDPASIVLGVGNVGGGIGLAWPQILSNFATLYTTTNLAAPSTWAPAPGSAFLSNQQLNLALPATNPASFYRLQLN